MAPERIEAVRRGLITNLAEEALTQIKFGFERGRAPDGTAWKPLKNPPPRRRGGIPLNDHGILKNAWTRILLPNGFTWQNNLVYARPHQYGAQISHRARANVHAKNGKFISRQRASQKKSKNRVSFSPASVQGLPARPMVPNGDLPPIWKIAFERAAKSTLLGYGMGG